MIVQFIAFSFSIVILNHTIESLNNETTIVIGYGYYYGRNQWDDKWSMKQNNA